MIEAFKKAGLPEPIFEELAGGLQVTLLKDIYTEEYLRKLDLSDRQIKAIVYTKKQKKYPIRSTSNYSMFLAIPLPTIFSSW